jgi:hypothetical protein
MIVIDGTSYNVPIVSLVESCDFLDKFAQRTIDGVLHRELIGCYFNQQLTFASPVTTADRTHYQALWVKLSEPVTFHTVTVPDSDGVNFTFSMYVANLKRTLKKWDGSKTYWKTMTVNFTAGIPARKP